MEWRRPTFLRRWPDRQMKTSRRYKTIVGCGEAGAPAPPETGADPRDEACEAAHEGTVGALCEGLVAVERTAKKLDEKCSGPLPTSPEESHQGLKRPTC